MGYIKKEVGSAFRAASKVPPVCGLGVHDRSHWPLPEDGESIMEIVLQNKQTLNYVKAAGGWTRHPGQAQVFSTGLEAMCFCLHHQIFGMQILGQFADARMNFTLAVTDSRGASVGR